MSGTIVKRSGGFAPKITIAGKQIWIATFPEKELATASLEQVVKSPFPTFTFAELVDEYGRRPAVKPETHSHNTDMLRSFLHVNGRRPVASYLRFEAVKWANRNPSRVRYVRSLFTYAISLGIVAENPFAGLKATSKPKPKVPPTPEQVESVATAALARHTAPRGELLHDLVKVAAATGLRLHEAAGLTPEQVLNRPDGVFLTIIGKGEAYRLIYVPESVAHIVLWRCTSRLLFGHQGKKIDRRQIHRWMKPIREELGLPDMNWHLLRHFHATDMANRGVQDRDAAFQMFGHGDPRLLKAVYQHPDREKALERVRRTIDG